MSFRDDRQTDRQTDRQIDRDREAQYDKRMKKKKKKGASGIILITRQNKIIFFCFSSHEQCTSIYKCAL